MRNKTVAIYARVSTDKQKVDMQLRELLVDRVYNVALFNVFMQIIGVVRISCFRYHLY